MQRRILLAGIVGGVAMFIWTSIAHMVLPLGETGVREIPNESAVLTAMQSNIGTHPGLYLFPGYGLGPNATSAQKHEAMKHTEERMASNPSGLLMYFPPGRSVTMGRWLGIEFATELIEALLAIWLLAQTPIASFFGRVCFVVGVGIIAAIATNISYWNWYGFPAPYTLSYIFIQLVGFLCVGIVSGLILKNAGVGVTRAV